MQITHSPSTQKPVTQADWPVNAVPKHWIDSLFSKMSAYYGARFADAWKGSDLAQVQKAWAIELRKLSPEALKAGVDSLDRCKFPPTLPEFLALCREARKEQAPVGPMLTHTPVTDRETARKNLDRIRQLLAGAGMPTEHGAPF